MKEQNSTYDVAVIGGGLAGLSLAIQLSRNGFQVVLFEREKYPFHKVCGEYISMESWCFLQHLGVPLHQMELPLIQQLCLTAPNGKRFDTQLPLGGFGISRYKLDKLLYDIAIAGGVTVLDETRVDDVTHEDFFKIAYTNSSISGIASARVCCGAFGKRSNLDVKWKRTFITQPVRKENNYVAVKYHIKTDWPEHTIGLHNFRNGYCGISRIENGDYCFCYLTTAAELKGAGSIAALQQTSMRKNPALKDLLENSTVLDGFPISIAQVSFAKKTQVENGMLLLGDAGGMIAPLCGNGMSMALHASKLAAESITAHLQGHLTQAQMQAHYQAQWKKTFAPRLAVGRMLQHFFGSERLSNLFVQTFCTLPFLAQATIKKTHGQPF